MHSFTSGKLYISSPDIKIHCITTLQHFPTYYTPDSTWYNGPLIRIGKIMLPMMLFNSFFFSYIIIILTWLVQVHKWDSMPIAHRLATGSDSFCRVLYPWSVLSCQNNTHDVNPFYFFSYLSLLLITEEWKMNESVYINK